MPAMLPLKFFIALDYPRQLARFDTSMLLVNVQHCPPVLMPLPLAIHDIRFLRGDEGENYMNSILRSAVTTFSIRKQINIRF